MLVGTAVLTHVFVVAVPSPVPTPVAVNTTPTVLDAAPIDVKLVVPTVRIVYSVPTAKEPAVTVEAVLDVKTFPVVPAGITDVD